MSLSLRSLFLIGPRVLPAPAAELGLSRVRLEKVGLEGFRRFSCFGSPPFSLSSLVLSSPARALFGRLAAPFALLSRPLSLPAGVRLALGLPWNEAASAFL